jgi:hypothetical protein
MRLDAVRNATILRPLFFYLIQSAGYRLSAAPDLAFNGAPCPRLGAGINAA